MSEGKRPLRPAPSAGTPPTPTAPAVQRGKKEGSSRVSTACEACKKRKSRCVGRPPPCQMCRTCGTDCVIDASLDQRRKISTKRLAEQTEVQRELLSAILNAICSGVQSDVEELIRCIRSGQPPQVIAFCLQKSWRGDTGSAHLFTDLGIDYLLDAFASLSRERDAGESPNFGVEATATFADRRSPEASHDFAARSPRLALRQTYERWSRFLHTSPIASENLGDFAYGFGKAPDHGKIDRMNIDSTSASRFPPHGSDRASRETALKLRTPLASAIETAHQRSFWHPVMRISPESQVPTPTSAGGQVPDYLMRRPSAVSEVGSRDTTYVEILRCIPTLLSQEPPPTIPTTLNSLKYDLQLSRFAIHSVQPLSTYENSPLSRVITDYREAAQRFIVEENPPGEVLDMDGISVDLLFRDRTEADEFTVSNWASEVWRSFDDWDIYVRLAQILCYSTLMRWMLLPTAEQYAHIPEILKPTPLQCLVSHHSAIDFLPIPILRNGLIKNLRDWMTVLPSAGISVNWTKGIDGALCQIEATKQIRLSDEFTRHVMNLNNWSIGKSVLAFFPELGGSGAHNDETPIHLVDAQ